MYANMHARIAIICIFLKHISLFISALNVKFKLPHTRRYIIGLHVSYFVHKYLKLINLIRILYSFICIF